MEEKTPVEKLDEALGELVEIYPQALPTADTKAYEEKRKAVVESRNMNILTN